MNSQDFILQWMCSIFYQYFILQHLYLIIQFQYQNTCTFIMFCRNYGKAKGLGYYVTTQALLMLILFISFTMSEPSSIINNENIQEFGGSRLLQGRNRPYSRADDLLNQMAQIYDQKKIIYEAWENDTQLIAKPLLKLFDQLDQQLEQIIQKNNPSLKARLDQVYKFSPSKQAEFRNLQNQIREVQRIRDFRFHLHESYLSKIQPICPPRVKLSTTKQIQIPKTQELAKYNKSQDFIIVTPNGEKAYLQILYKHLLKQRDSFHQWHLWVGKNIQQNIKYMEKLEAENDWIKVKKLETSEPQNWKNMRNFWFTDCQPNKVYLRIQNDTVWLSNDFVSKMFEARIANPDHLLVYANIINNGLIDHINQHAGNFNFTQIAHHHCQGTGWGSIQIVKQIHDQFLNSIDRNTTSKFARSFQKWLPLNYQQISMNAVTYFSNTILSLQNIQDKDEDKLFSVDYPFTFEKTNLIVGNAICVNHMDDYQKEFLEKQPEILARYRNAAGL